MNNIYAELEKTLAPELLILGLIAIIWNILVFAIYVADKRRAKTRRRRISESTLITLAILMGGLGAGVAMLLLRHKTRKPLFCIVVPLALFLQIGGILWILMP